MKVQHLLSHVMVGRYSMFCRNGHHLPVAAPSNDCSVSLPDGVDSVFLDRNRIDLCADCLIARRAGQNDAIEAASSDLSFNGADAEAAHG